MEDIIVCKTEHEWNRKFMQVESPVVVHQTQTLIKYKGSLYDQLDDALPISRLRRIKQLGLAYYSFNPFGDQFYHLLTHTRYGHSLTFATKIDQLAQTLGLDRKAGVTAALSHDIATTPFSDSVSYASKINDEEYYDYVLERSPELLNVLQKNKISKEHLSNLIKGRDYSPLGELINNKDSIDVDRWSYVIDDAWFASVAPNSWRGKNLPDPFRHVEIYEGKIVFKDIDLVREFLEARVQMHEKIYKNDALAAKETFMNQVIEEMRKHVDLSTDNLLQMDDSHFERLAKKYGGQLGKDIFSIYGVFQSYGMLKASEEEAQTFLGKILDRPFAVRKTKKFNAATGTLILMDGKVETYRDLEPEHAEELKTRMEAWNHTTVYGYINDSKVEEAFDEAAEIFGEDEPESGILRHNEVFRETQRKAEEEFFEEGETL